MKIWLAPLHGITYYNFRNCFTKYFKGIDCAITPFIAVQSKEKFNPKKFPDLFLENNKKMPVIPQFMGNNPNDIKETIVALNETFGYKQFNWNIGCPMNQIVRKKRGCGLMPYPDLIEEVVNEVCGKTSARFSIKMRLGQHHLNEGFEIIQRLNSYPIDFLCIHPRLGVHQYGGIVDLDSFDTFYQTTCHTIVYSGDINDLDFFMYLQKRFPKIKNWMLGRGILQNPFLAEQIKGTQITQINKSCADIFINFYNEYSEILLTIKNEKIALGALKELWHYFAIFWKIDAKALQELLQINDYHTFQKYIKLKIYNY